MRYLPLRCGVACCLSLSLFRLYCSYETDSPVFIKSNASEDAVSRRRARAASDIGAPTYSSMPRPPDVQLSLAQSCSKFSACFCSDAVRPAAFQRGLAHAAEYMVEANLVSSRIRSTQDLECHVVARRIRVLLPTYGLGGSILDHVRRLAPVWKLAALEERRMPAIAVPAYEPFAGNLGNRNAYLWAAYDDTLPCDAWFGCYWEELARPCGGVPLSA